MPALGALALGIAVFGCAEGSSLGDEDPGAGQGPGRDSGAPRDGAATDDASVLADGAAPDAPPSSSCTSALAAATFDFESGAAGWTHGIMDGAKDPPDWPHDPWEIGTASNGTSCASGSCFGSPLTQNYAQCARGYLMSPKLDLEACKGQDLVLAFDHAYAFWREGASFFDGGVVQVSGDDGATWTVPPANYPGELSIKKKDGDQPADYHCLVETFEIDKKPGFTGRESTTSRFEVPFPSSLVTGKTRIRFAFAAGLSSRNSNPDGSRVATAFGWRVDNVALTTK